MPRKVIKKRKEPSFHVKRKIKSLFTKVLRLIIVLVVIFGGAYWVTEKLTPSEHIIKFKRECNNNECAKIIDPEEAKFINNEINTLQANLERIEFFAKFTFLRFNFQVNNQSQFHFTVTDPPLEKDINIMMQCNLNGQTNIFSHGAGIIFMQKSSIKDIAKELNNIQNILITCNPASQHLEMVGTPFPVASGAEMRLVYSEDKYSLKFLPDKWNYWLILLQVFMVTGIIYSGYYAILRFIIKGLK